MGMKMLSPKKAYMVLLAAEHGEEEPDSGAQEGSGDGYELSLCL
jgi:hypothetical protein